ACHNAFGGGSSRSTTATTDRRIAAEGSRVATEGAMVSESGSIQIGEEGRFQESGSIGGDQNIAGNVSITTSDPELIKEALNIYSQLSGQTSAVLADANAESAFLASQAAGALGDVKAAELTGGASVWRTTIMVVALGALAV